MLTLNLVSTKSTKLRGSTKHKEKKHYRYLLDSLLTLTVPTVEIRKLFLKHLYRRESSLFKNFKVFGYNRKQTH